MGFFDNIVNAVTSKAQTAVASAVSTAQTVAKVVNAAQKNTTSTTRSTGGGGGGGGAAEPVVREPRVEERTRTYSYTPPINEPAISDTDIVTWSGNGGISFFVKPKTIQGIKGFNIHSSTDTEDMENDGEKFIQKKNAGSIEITLNAELNGFVGADVKGIADRAIDAARRGEIGYFYCYGKKMYASQFMMTSAEANDIVLNSKGGWISCTLNMTLKQSTKADGTITKTETYTVEIWDDVEIPTGGGGGGNPGGNTGGNTKVAQSIVAGVKNAIAVVQSVAATVKATNDAKKQSQSVLNNSKRNTGGIRGTGEAFD